MVWDPGTLFSLSKFLDRLDYVTENAGLDFSPDGMVMYIAFQDRAIWQFWREDGCKCRYGLEICKS